MNNRNWKCKQQKSFDSQNRVIKSKRHLKKSDDLRSAMDDSDCLKRKKKRLSLDWFFRPEDD